MSSSPPRKRARRLTRLSAGRADVLSKSEWTEEEDIPKRLYDHTKKHDGYVDDTQYVLDKRPYRSITDWFLAKSGQGDVTRVALPTTRPNFTFPSSIDLYGVLEPNRLFAEGQPPMKVSIKRLRKWVPDRYVQSSQAGIWIETKSSWYKLKRPEEKSITLPDGNTVSQESLHLRMRAVFGLVLNLSAMLGELREVTSSSPHRRELINYFEAVHKNHTPDESHMILSPGLELLEQHPELPSEPFDLELLRREVGLVRKLLRKFDEGFTIKKSKFMKGLFEMEKDFRESKKRGDAWISEEIDYLSSAIASERRGGFTPWGDRVPNAEPCCPNRVFTMRGDPAAIEDRPSSMWANESQKSSPLPSTRTLQIDNKDYLSKSLSSEPQAANDNTLSDNDNSMLVNQSLNSPTVAPCTPQVNDKDNTANSLPSPPQVADGNGSCDDDNGSCSDSSFGQLQLSDLPPPLSDLDDMSMTQDSERAAESLNSKMIVSRQPEEVNCHVEDTFEKLDGASPSLPNDHGMPPEFNGPSAESAGAPNSKLTVSEVPPDLASLNPRTTVGTSGDGLPSKATIDEATKPVDEATEQPQKMDCGENSTFEKLHSIYPSISKAHELHGLHLSQDVYSVSAKSAGASDGEVVVPRVSPESSSLDSNTTVETSGDGLPTGSPNDKAMKLLADSAAQAPKLPSPSPNVGNAPTAQMSTCHNIEASAEAPDKETSSTAGGLNGTSPSVANALAAIKILEDFAEQNDDAYISSAVEVAKIRLEEHYQ